MNPRWLRLTTGALVACLSLSLLPAELLAEVFDQASQCCESSCCLLGSRESRACPMQAQAGADEDCSPSRSCSIRSSKEPGTPAATPIESLLLQLRPAIFAQPTLQTADPAGARIEARRSALPAPPALRVAVPPPESL